MAATKLDNSELENIEDCLPHIEKMYNFKFEDEELESVKIFDEFCDLIIKKINLKNDETCTSQQAFYKLRKSLDQAKIIEKEKLNTKTELEYLFPRKNRKNLIKKVENEMKFRFDILKAPDFITILLLMIGLLSFVFLFFYWKVGLIGILLSLCGFYLCKLFGNELEVKTVRSLVEKITEENYLQVRTEQNTINKIELKEILINWFSENSGIDRQKLLKSTFR